MKRLLTLASAGLFATGLAIFPVSVFAQPNAATGTDTKAQTTVPVTGHDAKQVPASKAALSKDAAKSPAVSKDADKVDAAKAGSVKAGSTAAPISTSTPASTPTSTPAKVGG